MMQHRTPDATSPPLDVVHLSRSYGTTLALDDVSLTLEQGTAIAVVGPNGAGKTTLIECILGLARPSRGEVLLLGTPPSLSEHAHEVGVVLADSGFPPEVPVGALLELLGRVRGVDVWPMAERFGLATLLARPFETLSLGQRQRVRLAIGLAGTPRLVVADEPATALDLDARTVLREVLDDHRARGAALLVATHDLGEAEAIADRLFLLHRGRCLADAPPAQVRRLAGIGEVRATLPGPYDPTAHEHLGAELVAAEGLRVTLRARDTDALAHALLHQGAHSLEIAPLSLEHALSALIDATEEVKQ